MGYLGEQVKAELAHAPLRQHLLAQPEATQPQRVEPCGQNCQRCGIHHPGPPPEPPRLQYGYGERGVGAPPRVGGHGPYAERIRSRPEVGVLRHRPSVGSVPLAVFAVEPVHKERRLGVGVVHVREAQRDVALVVPQLYAPRHSGPVGHGSQRGVLPRFEPVDHYIGYQRGPRPCHVALRVNGAHGQHAAESAEEQRTIGCHRRRALRADVALQGGSEAVACGSVVARVDPRDAFFGARPDVAVTVFHHRAHVVVDKPLRHRYLLIPRPGRALARFDLYQATPEPAGIDVAIPCHGEADDVGGRQRPVGSGQPRERGVVNAPLPCVGGVETVARGHPRPATAVDAHAAHAPLIARTVEHGPEPDGALPGVVGHEQPAVPCGHIDAASAVLRHVVNVV